MIGATSKGDVRIRELALLFKDNIMAVVQNDIA